MDEYNMAIMFVENRTPLVWAANEMRLDRHRAPDRKPRIAAIFFFDNQLINLPSTIAVHRVILKDRMQNRKFRKLPYSHKRDEGI